MPKAQRILGCTMYIVGLLAYTPKMHAYASIFTTKFSKLLFAHELCRCRREYLKEKSQHYRKLA